jgi:RNA polymerase sigma factor (sigma-70 family)
MLAELDRGLLDAAQAQDAAWFEEQLRPLLSPGFRLAQSMLRDPHEAEDAVQEAALNAWRKLHQFEDRGSGLGPWFLGVVANQCRTRLRSRWWQVWRRGDVEQGARAGHEESTVFRADLARALDRLSSDQCAALYLYYQLDLPQETVARILGIRVGTVKSKLHRAMHRLRAAMDEETDKR